LTLGRTGQLLGSGLVLAALTVGPGFSRNRDAVFVSFDHVVRPVWSRRNSDSALLWLRLRNNSRAPIQVLASAPEAGAEGVEIVHEIVPDSAVKPKAEWISPPEHYSPVNEATTAEVPANRDLLFSVPLNHVGPWWRLRITFEFLATSSRSKRQAQRTVDFTWADVPPIERGAWKK